MRVWDLNDRLSTRLGTLPGPAFVLLGLTLTYLIVLPMALFSDGLGDGPRNIKALSVAGQLLVVSVLGPLIEAAILQQWVIRALRRRRWPWALAIVASAVAFGVSHWYSRAYVVFAFLVGLVMAYGYAVLWKVGRRAFLLIFIVHALRNTISTVVLQLSQ